MRLTASEQAERVSWSIKSWNRMNFVTATLAESVSDPKVISARWTVFVKNLRRIMPGLRVIRVLQRHPGGHGWHVHALMDRYVASDLILGEAERAGLGRMDFRMVSGEQRQNVVAYLVRYVTRDLRFRDCMSKGVRMLTASGHLRCAVRWWRRYVDLTVVSTTAVLRRSMFLILESMGLVLPKHTPNLWLFGCAPPAAHLKLREMHPQLVG